MATCMGECAHPDCKQRVVKPKTKNSDAVVIGEIAHIHAASDNGPRANPEMSDADRNRSDNLIVLCANHHLEIDKQPETFPATMLLDWKEKHDRKFYEPLGAKIGDIGYLELEQAARSFLRKDAVVNGGELTITAPEDKISKNGLGNRSKKLLQMGAAVSAEVGDVITKSTQLDPEFPDKLRQGFVIQYSTFVREGFEGDDLFTAMFEWAAGAHTDIERKAAGLPILAHLFIICDVFKK